MDQYLLGIDLGSSSVKVSIVNARRGACIASAQSPDNEMPIQAIHPGWAEQSPHMWWEHTVQAIQLCMKKANLGPSDIQAIGIAYQMHGLVCLDRRNTPIRPSIIWCDSRAVKIGQEAFHALDDAYCLKHYLNSPGNFTASKLRWIKVNEPTLYDQIHKIMLPGDYLAFRLTGDITTTETGLSEGIFWDYEAEAPAEKLLAHYGLDKELLPNRVPLFGIQGYLTEEVARELGLLPLIPVSYRAGDQPNNAFSLNVNNPGETAVTAGTSGVMYTVTDQNAYDAQSRVNTFIHVNNKWNGEGKRNGVLLCVNGTGILYNWIRRIMKVQGHAYTYDQMNSLAGVAPPGSDGLRMFPFGNGAERMLENQEPGGLIANLNFNRHEQPHLLRAAQEGIVFALNYGFEIFGEMGIASHLVRAGHANMFLSSLFRKIFVNTTGLTLERYDTDGASGAAVGAGIGAGIFNSFEEAFENLKCLGIEEPDNERGTYQEIYLDWKERLQQHRAVPAEIIT